MATRRGEIEGISDPLLFVVSDQEGKWIKFGRFMNKINLEDVLNG